MPTGWTGSVETCTVGTEAPESLAATLHAVNTLRSLAGLPPVTFSAEKNARALAAALMMKAAGRLSHITNPAWPCYSSAGALGARTSNLAIGSSGADAIRRYMSDAETPSLGHRRWILDPRATEFGSGSTDTTNALTVVGSDPDASPETVVSWPPPGWVPWPWIFDDWSLALGNGSSKVSFEGATVAVALDGIPVPVSNVSTLPAGFGTGTTLRWEVAIPPSATDGDHTITVVVAGATRDGRPVPIAYTVDAFDPEPATTEPAITQPATTLPSSPIASGNSAECEKAAQGLDKANERLVDAKLSLRRAKSSGHDNRISKAKQRVQAARARVKLRKEQLSSACGTRKR